jgi:hypothetical protein
VTAVSTAQTHREVTCHHTTHGKVSGLHDVSQADTSAVQYASDATHCAVNNTSVTRLQQADIIHLRHARNVVYTILASHCSLSLSQLLKSYIYLYIQIAMRMHLLDWLQFSIDSTNDADKWQRLDVLFISCCQCWYIYPLIDWSN